jgi:glycosyltransferase involved in cell wall biosynthesis
MTSQNDLNIPSHFFVIGQEWFPCKPGGLNRYVYELANQLAQEGNQIDCYGYGMPDNSGQRNLQLINLGYPKDPIWKRLYASQFINLQRDKREIDAINFHFAPYSFALLKNISKNVPITFTFHGPWALESEQEKSSRLNVLIKFWIEKWVYGRCDRFIVLSNAFGKILHETYQVPWSKIHVIPGGVNTNRFQCNLSRKEARNRLDWPVGRPILFTPRRLVHRMGLDELLKAIVEVKRKIPDVWLAIAGKGPLKDSLESQVKTLQLEQHVQFLGFLPDEQLPVAYQAADLTVIPTLCLEGFGLVLLESLSCGTPPLCTPIGGMPEVLEALDQNLITESVDSWAIAERIIEFLSNSMNLPSRETCRDYVVNHFDWQIIAPRLKRVLLDRTV